MCKVGDIVTLKPECRDQVLFGRHAVSYRIVAIHGDKLTLKVHEMGESWERVLAEVHAVLEREED